MSSWQDNAIPCKGFRAVKRLWLPRLIDVEPMRTRRVEKTFMSKVNAAPGRYLGGVPPLRTNVLDEKIPIAGSPLIFP